MYGEKGECFLETDRKVSSYRPALSGQCEDNETRPGAMCHGEADFVAQCPGAYIFRKSRKFSGTFGVT